MRVCMYPCMCAHARTRYRSACGNFRYYQEATSHISSLRLFTGLYSRTAGADGVRDQEKRILTWEARIYPQVATLTVSFTSVTQIGRAHV